MSKSKKKIAVQRERAAAAEETYTALSAMEETLRRLGLREELECVATHSSHSSYSSPPRTQKNFTVEYLASIRKSREEAAKLRYEKEYRQFASEEQRRENELMLSAVNESKVLSDLIEKAHDLLERETREAEALHVRRVQDASERVFRAQHLDRMRAVVSRSRETETGLTGDNGAHATSIFFDPPPSAPSAAARAKALMTWAYCEQITTGLVELAVRVADNQYSAEGVRRVPQDLAVTQWNTWVDTLLFPPQRPLSDVLSRSTLRELRDPRARSAAQEGSACGQAEGKEQELQQQKQEQGSEEETEEQRAPDYAEEIRSAAAGVLHRVSSLNADYNASLVTRSVVDASHQLRAAEFAQLHNDLNGMRSAGTVLTEAVSGWARRLPPVASFVFGDELSGARALAEGAMRNDDPAAVCRVIVPAMLARAPASLVSPAGGNGAGAGGGGAKGARRTEATGVSGPTRGRQPDEITEARVYYETLSDALVWEMVAVYKHNCLALAREALGVEAAKPQVAPQPEARKASSRRSTQPSHKNSIEILSENRSSVSGAEAHGPPPLRSLLLVCFPEVEAFWRIFIPRLSAAVEHAELEMERVLRGDAGPDGEMSEKAGRGRKNARMQAQNSRSRGAGMKSNTKNMRRGPRGSSQATDGDATPRVFAFPPLCITGIFLQFDVLSRYERLRGAVHGPSGLYHPVFAPDPARVTPCPDEDANTSRSSSPYPHTHPTSSGLEGCGDWSIDRMRRELLEQDRRMRRLWDLWPATIARASVPPEVEPEKPTTLEGKKRSRSVFVAKSGDNSRRAATPTSMAMVPQSFGSPISQSNGGAKPATVQFPRVLVFRRRADISPPLRHTSTTAADMVEALMGVLSTRGGVMCVRSAEIVPGLLPAPLHIGDYRLTPTLLAQLVDTHAKATARWEAAMAKATGKNAAGIKSTCAARTEKKAQISAQDPSSSEKKDNSSDIGGDDNNAVWAEMEVFRAFRGFATELLQFMNGVFPQLLWDTEAFGSNGFTRTTHFAAVDRNYEYSREALYKLLDDGSARLVGACALLLRYTADMALRHVADALVRVCAVVQRQMEPSTNAHQEPQQSPLSTPEQGNLPQPEPHHHQQHQQHQENRDDSCASKALDDNERSSSLCAPAVTEWKLGGPSSARAALEQLRERFVSSVPRLSHAEAVAMISHLGGQPVSLDSFRHALRAYATRVEHVVTDCFRFFLHSTCAAKDTNMIAGGDSIAPKIARTLLSYLFATGENEGGGDLPRVAVSLARVAALVHAIRRCFIVTARGAARWIDTMYVAALAVPPQGNFPPSGRPVDICSVLAPPAPAVQHSGVPPLSLALESVEAIAPSLGLSNAEERDFWRETEVEIVLQCFSIYQKSQVDEAEFIHCALLAQIGELWSFLPSRANELAQNVKFDAFFNMESLLPDGETSDAPGPSVTDVSRLSITALTHVEPSHTESAFSRIAAEADIARLFHTTFRAQQQLQPNGTRRPSTVLVDAFLSPISSSLQSPQGSGCPTSSQRSPAATSPFALSSFLSPPRIALREFFMSALLQRCSLKSGGASALECLCCARGVREPSVSELRELVRSLPHAVRVQRHNVPACGVPITAKEWDSVKWWHFAPKSPDRDSDETDETSPAAQKVKGEFEQRYLLRVLTMCFAFSDVALCRRCVPFLPDVLALAARTRGSQATLERYFHAFTALQSACDGDEAFGSESPPTGQLALFSHSISVEEALFFRGAGDPALRGPCVAPGGHLLPDQRSECDPPPRAAAPAEEEESTAEAAMPLDVELRLLLVAEAAAGLTLPLLGASHWGRPLVPRLAAVPQEATPARRTAAAEETEEEEGSWCNSCAQHGEK